MIDTDDNKIANKNIQRNNKNGLIITNNGHNNAKDNYRIDNNNHYFNKMHHGINVNKETTLSFLTFKQFCVECTDYETSQHVISPEQKSYVDNDTNNLTSMLLSRILPEVNDDELTSLRKLVQDQVEQIKRIQDRINKEEENNSLLESKFKKYKEAFDNGMRCQVKEEIATNASKSNRDGSVNKTPTGMLSHIEQRKLMNKDSKELYKRSKIKFVYSPPLSQKGTALKPVTIGEKKKKQKGLGHFFRPVARK